MPKMSRAHMEARFNEILDAAEACFIRRGVHQTTMHDICEEARLSPGAVYRYFKGKEDLIDAMAERRLVREMEVIEEARAQTPQALQALNILGERFWNRFLSPDFERWARLDIETWPEALRNPRHRDRLKHLRREFRAALTEVCRLAIEQGNLSRSVDPSAMATLLIALYRGLQLDKATDPEGADTEEVLRVFRLGPGRSGGVGPSNRRQAREKKGSERKEAGND